MPCFEMLNFFRLGHIEKCSDKLWNNGVSKEIVIVGLSVKCMIFSLCLQAKLMVKFAYSVMTVLYVSGLDLYRLLCEACFCYVAFGKKC